MVSGTAGCSWQNWGSILQDNGWWSTVTESAPEASFAVAGGIEGENGQIGTMQFNPLAGVGLVFTKKLENQPEKIKKYLQVFDAISGDPAWHEAEIWGIEGETFEYDENGDRQFTEAYAAEDARIKFGFGDEYRFPTLEKFQYDPEVDDAIDYSKK